jgi:hypothetical protein
LTTITIIQKYLKGRTYSVEYATREGSKDFIDNIIENAKKETTAKNIDYYFMTKRFCPLLSL